ncbi:hypothetical protein AB6D11_18510 [Vibrio splendidus]
MKQLITAIIDWKHSGIESEPVNPVYNNTLIEISLDKLSEQISRYVAAPKLEITEDMKTYIVNSKQPVSGYLNGTLSATMYDMSDDGNETGEPACRDAQLVVDTHSLITNLSQDSSKTQITDLLTNLYHLMDEKGIDRDEVLEASLVQYLR